MFTKKFYELILILFSTKPGGQLRSVVSAKLTRICDANDHQNDEDCSFWGQHDGRSDSDALINRHSSRPL